MGDGETAGRRLLSPAHRVYSWGVAGRPPLRLELLGGFRVLEESRAPSRAPSVRQQQIVALLILQARRGPIPRQRVAGFLWPDSSDEQALTNLRRELHHLRESWPKLDFLVDAGTRMLAWRDGKGAVDLGLRRRRLSRSVWKARSISCTSIPRTIRSKRKAPTSDEES